MLVLIELYLVRKDILLNNLLFLIFNSLNPSAMTLNIRCHQLLPVFCGIIIVQIDNLYAESIPVHPPEGIIVSSLTELVVALRLLEFTILLLVGLSVPT